MSGGLNKTTVLFVASLASFLTPFMGSSINIALPLIGSEFAGDALLLTWVPTAYLLSSAVFIVPFGRLADIHGKVRIFIGGIILYTLGSLLSAVAFSLLVLIVFRIIQGVGAAMIFGTGVALITSVFPREERGSALGYNVAAVYLGLSMGPPLGGILTHNFGWRSIFVLNVLLGVIIIIFALRRLKSDWKEGGDERFDIAGAFIYGIMLVLMMYGFSRLPTGTGIGSFLIGIIMLILFLFRELRTEYPVLDVRIFVSNRVFGFSNLAAFINYSATFAIAFLLSLYLQYLQGLDAQTAGIVLVAQPLMQTLFSPSAGRLSDRIEPRFVASAGMALTTLGLVLLTLITQDTSILFIVGIQALLGLGFALFSSPNTNAVMSSVEKAQYGIASGTIATMRLIGMMLSMGIVLITFSLFIGRVQITPDVYPLFLTGMKTAFGLFALMCAAGIFASFQRGKVRS
jgi:EmrB/QacA subfamily drug resistance transporter